MSNTGSGDGQQGAGGGTPPQDGEAGAAPKRSAHDQRALQDKLTEARARLLFLHPFLGYLVTNLEDRLGAEWLSTAGTDGQVVHWSDDFVAKLTKDDTMFVLAHEALHCALQHMWRRTGRDPQRWNIACDAVVNDLLIEAGLAGGTSQELNNSMIKGGKGRATEEVYEDIEGLLKQNGAGRKTLDDHDGWTDKQADPRDPRQRNLSDMWRAALAQASKFGKVPAGMERHVERVLRPKRDWRDLLRDGLFFPEDYQWVPTDRRFPEVLLPTLTGEVHRVVVAIDTSGSIYGEKLRSFWTELVAILRNNRCEARVLTCDAAIQDEFDEVQFDPANVNHLRGGGGTSFVPVFERVEQYMTGGWRPEAVVYLTDLDGSFPPRAPDVRTIWVVEKEDGRKTVPFGEVIVLD